VSSHILWASINLNAGHLPGIDYRACSAPGRGTAPAHRAFAQVKVVAPGELVVVASSLAMVALTSPTTARPAMLATAIFSKTSPS